MKNFLRKRVTAISVTACLVLLIVIVGKAIFAIRSHCVLHVPDPRQLVVRFLLGGAPLTAVVPCIKALIFAKKSVKLYSRTT